jgi:hypothetical protein
MIGLVTVSLSFGQDKKSEQKIKVVVDDGSGSKTVLDTVITGNMPGKLELKDGKIIILGDPGKGLSHIDTFEGKGKVYVTVTSDNEDDGKKSKEQKIIIASAGDADAVWEKEDGGKIVIVSDGNIATTKGSSYFTVTMDSDKDRNTDVTKYVVAKDGIVVTVEGEDEEKAREIIEEVQKKLGVEKESEKVKDNSKK